MANNNTRAFHENADTAGRRSLDHFVISVKDMESAGANYEHLGFHVLPTARHIELGSCNRIIQFESTYIELIGDLDKSRAVHGEKMLKRFSAGEGLSIVSLTSADLERDRMRLVEEGYTPEPVVSARREIRMPDGSNDQTDSSCFYHWRIGKEYLSLFYSVHNKPATIFVPEYYNRHPNTASAITGIVYISEDPLADVNYFKTMFRFEPGSATSEAVHFETPRGETLDIVSPGFYTQMRPHAGSVELGKLSGFPIELSVKVASLEKCERVLSANAVSRQRLGNTLFVGPASSNGVFIAFEE